MSKVLGFRYDAGIRLVVKAGEEIELPENIMRELIKAFGEAALAEAREQEREAAKGLVETLGKIRDLIDQANGTLRDPHISAKERKTYLINNQFETDRVAANALATYREKSGEKV